MLIPSEITQPAKQYLEELGWSLAVLHEIPLDTILIKKTFVYTEGFYQSYEQLPAGYRARTKNVSLFIDHTGIDHSGILYEWEKITFTGFISCSILKQVGEDYVPYFNPIFITVTTEGELLVARHISNPDFSSIVQLYKRKWQYFKDHPPKEPKPFLYDIRPAIADDMDEMRQMFKDTIHTVNANDYSHEQLAAWSSSAENEETWNKRLKEQYFLVTHDYKEITGFASLAFNGCIDLLYVHKDHQRKGIAETLVRHLEHYAREQGLVETWADVSITAKPFFTSKGFTIKREYLKFVQGVEFQNTIMVKSLKPTKV